MKNNLKLNALMETMQKKFGEDKIMWGSKIPIGSPISTGSLALDFGTGFGGFPSNRVVEICGKEGTGKTTLALFAMVNAIKRTPTRGALILDLEHKITPDWLELIVGEELLDKRVMYLQPTSIEEATNMYRSAVESGQVACSLLDSIGGAPTIRRNEDATVGHYGGNSIGVGEWSRTAATLSSVYDCLTVGINQTRADMSGYNQLNTPGGTAWKHACVMRIELVRGREKKTIKLPAEKEPFPIGYNIFAKVRKNQVGAPGRIAEYWFHNVWTEEYGFGINQLEEITRLALATGVIERRGAYYSHPALPIVKGESKVLGLDALKALVMKDEALAVLLTKEVMASLSDHADVVPISDPTAPVPGAAEEEKAPTLYQKITDLPVVETID